MAKYNVAYVGPAQVPIAVPFICRKNALPNLKMLFFITNSRAQRMYLTWTSGIVIYSGGL